MTTTVQGLAVRPPHWLALVSLAVVIKNTSGAPASAAWSVSAQTASGLRTLEGSDLSVTPGSPIVSPIVPATIAAGASEVFTVTCLCQFPRSVAGAVFAFVSSTLGAIQPVSPVLVQVLNYAFRASVDWPVGAGDSLPSLDVANPMGPLIPASAPTSYALPLLDWV